MKKHLFITQLLLLITLWVGASGFDKATYYSAASGKKGQALKTALAGIIYTSNSVGYDGLKATYKTTDVRSDGYLYDMYSNTTSYVAGSAFASTYKNEGDGYNREHTIPQSLFNEAAPMKADLYHVYPIDAALNGERANYCHGEVNTSASYGKSNGGFSKWGSPSNELISNGCEEGKVFEPNDEYKGDFARTYFYFVTCYQTKMTSLNSYGMFDKSTYPSFTDWAKTMLLKWAKNDPVSTKEAARIEAVYATAQGNRNPFIDFPGLEQYIWGDYMDVAFDPSNYQNPYDGNTSTTPSISLSQTSATLQVGKTLTLSATTQNAGTAQVSWSSSNASVVTVSGGTVTGVAAGSATITASIVVSGVTYTATCAVTVTSQGTIPSEGDIYVKVTSTSDITDGQYLIVYESGNVAFNGGLIDLKATSSSSPNTIPVSIDDNQIPVNSTTEAAEFTLCISAGNIKSKSGYYIGNTSDSNNLECSTSTAFTNSLSISLNNVDIVGSGGAYLRYNASISGFRYYKSSTYNQQKAIQLYKKTESVPLAPSISLNKTSVTEEVGNTFTLTATTQNADGATIVWASSNPQVATVTNGLVRCVASGATSISATISVNNVSVAATCNVTVVDNSSSGGEGTLENPYSVAEVLALYAANNVPTSKVYVKGVISRITEVSANYGNATYYISDDGTTTNHFYVFRGKYLNQANFTSNDQIQVGDEVVIYGQLTTYGTINEFAANNYIVSLNRPSDVLLGDVNKDGDITIADVTALVNIILGKDTTGYDLVAADVNEDGDRTIADVTALVNIILGK